MNRRRFLKWLGIGASAPATAAVASTFPKGLIADRIYGGYTPHPDGLGYVGRFVVVAPDGVRLPCASAGTEIVIYNASAEPLRVFPLDSEIMPARIALFIADDRGDWTTE